MTATVEDIAANQVRITMSAHDLVGDEDATRWYFNLDEGLQLDPSNFSFARAASDPGTVGNVDIGVGTNTTKADGSGGFYDLTFDLPPPGNRLSAGELLVYDITYSGAGTFGADSFKFLSSDGFGGTTQYYSAVKIQSLAGGESTWVGATDVGGGGGGGPGGVVPEPGTMVLLGTGLLGIAGVTRRRGKKGKNEEEPAS